MLGALHFFHVSYLWSVKFWTSIISKDFQLRKTFCFAVLILICVTIAATAVPSSANLFIATGLLEDSHTSYLEESYYALDGCRSLEGNYYLPYTTATCVSDTVQSSSDQAPLRFVRLSETASELERGGKTFSVPGLTKGQFIYNIPGNSSQFRYELKFLELLSCILKAQGTYHETQGHVL